MRSTIQFTPDSRRLVVQGSSGLSIIDVQGAVPPIEIGIANIHAFATVVDQIWVIAGSPAMLTTYDARGTKLGVIEVPAPDGTTRLLRTSSGLLACWRETQIVSNPDHGLAVTTLAGEPDFVLPLTATRTIVSSRHGLALRDRDLARWTISLAMFGTIVDAALVLDGKAIAVSVRAATSYTIVVLAMRDGATLHRITIADAEVIRFAPGRGIALVQTHDSHLVLLDLRFGRLIADYQEQRSIVEAAIEDSGREVALRVSDQPDQVVLVSVADLLSMARTIQPAPVIAAVAPVVVESPPVEEEPVAPVDPFHAEELVLAGDALPHRPAIEATSPEQTAILHAHHRELAIAVVGVAIARAWDEGRLAHPQPAGLPFHSEVSGVTSNQRGLASDELATAQRRIEDISVAARDARRAVAPCIGPLDALGNELGLSPLARDLLLMVAAPSLWGETARLYGILSNDEGRPLVDELLLCELLGTEADRWQIARELDEDAPLIRYGVIRVLSGAMRPFLPLVVEPVVLKLLRGAAIETELEPLAYTLSTERTFDELRIPTATKRRLVADLGHSTRPLRIAIRGRVGSGRHTLLAVIAAAAGRPLGVIDATTIVRDAPVRISALAEALDRLHLAGLFPCIDGLELIASQDVTTRDQVREVIRRHPGPVAIRLPWEAQPSLDPGYILIDLPVLTLTDRLTCWRRTLKHHGLHVGELTELADRYAIAPGVIERVAADIARSGDRTADAGLRLDAGIRQHLETRLGTSANRVARLASWGQVVLPADIQDSLTELIARIKHRRIVFDTWGFDRLMSTSRGVTALFQGGPGTGKTLVASAIANELGMDLYRVDLSRVMSKWIGETEQNLAKLFDAAEDGNTIILFDEADSLFAKRTEVKSSVDRYANLEVNYLLQRIDSFEGIAILTTNFGTSIDSAFKRRLSLRLTFPFPDEDMREKLWQAHLPPELPISGDFDLGEIARRYRMSGGYIRNVTLRAAFLAAEEHSPLTQGHLERAIKAEFREIGKIADSGVLE